MNKYIVLSATILSVATGAAQTNPESRRATITGAGGHGRCAIEVSVDGSAAVEISDDTGVLTTVSGQPAVWRRFQCNTPLPRRPMDFSLGRVGGRGFVRLLEDPRRTGGRVLIQISDSQGGRGNYRFDLEWRPGRDGGWTPGPPPPFPGQGSPMARAIRACQDSVMDRLDRDGYSSITFERSIPDSNPGRNVWITGVATASREFGPWRFSFTCSIDFSSGRTRSVDVRRR